MKRMGLVVSMFALGGSFWLDIAQVWGAEGVITRTPVSGGNYCRLRFPAIREETLFSSRPVLKDPTDGDIVDFYGPCDYDPLGKEEIRRQRADVRRDRRNDMDGD
ncbi:MAG TPA: hypothetical protein VK200_16580 [Candidatus Limnocylindrales bacterium]|nr:hypothetical protein [Candidatus Limnocylindrales bacterium]